MRKRVGKGEGERERERKTERESESARERESKQERKRERDALEVCCRLRTGTIELFPFIRCTHDSKGYVRRMLSTPR